MEIATFVATFRSSGRPQTWLFSKFHYRPPSVIQDLFQSNPSPEIVSFSRNIPSCSNCPVRRPTPPHFHSDFSASTPFSPLPSSVALRDSLLPPSTWIQKSLSQSTTMSSMTHNRLFREYKTLSTSPPDGITAGPVSEDNMFHWEALIQGPEGTPYEGGIFAADLIFPRDYPLNPPMMKFVSGGIWHPNGESPFSLFFFVCFSCQKHL